MLQTVDVVVSLAEEEAENAAVALATIAACGSSFCSSAAADAAITSAADAATTAACGSSFCSSAAAEWAMDAAVSTVDASMKIEAVWVVMAAVAAALTADANLISEKGSGVRHSVPFSLFSKIENLINTLQKIHRRQILPCRPLSD